MKRNIFFTSDWHVGHNNCLRFDDRPFNNIDEMHRTLISNYNKMVKKNDICYFLGDFSMCGFDIAKDVLSQLNGTKVCVLGNHDRGMNSMLTMGFDLCIYNASIMIESKIVTLSHYPLLGVPREDCSRIPHNIDINWHGEKYNRKYAVHDIGQYHLHGHTHASKKTEQFKPIKTDRQFDIGVVGNNYFPVSTGTVAKWIRKQEVSFKNKP